MHLKMHVLFMYVCHFVYIYIYIYIYIHWSGNSLSACYTNAVKGCEFN